MGLLVTFKNYLFFIVPIYSNFNEYICNFYVKGTFRNAGICLIKNPSLVFLKGLIRERSTSYNVHATNK